MDELYLDNIDEFVNDHNKIVTYKWLSLTLGVHVNVAKQMLYHYLEQRRQDRSAIPLHATYLVSGKRVDNGSPYHKVAIVREDKLEDVKSKMDPAISIHVYSVQKAELKDSSPLYSTDYDAVKENLKNCNKYSAVRYAAAVPLSVAESQHVQETASEEVGSKSTSHYSNAVASKPNTKVKKGIIGMFAIKNPPKNQDSNKDIKLEQKETASTIEPAKKKEDGTTTIVNRFGKNTKIQEKGADKVQTSVDVECSKSPNSPTCIKKEEPADSKAFNEKKKDVRSKTKRDDYSDSDNETIENQKKRRRRIKPQTHSSSGDDGVQDSPTLPDCPVKTELLSCSETFSEDKRRKRRRVLKSHTFVDDEGCMVTEKGYQSESYSESDDNTKANQKKTAIKPSVGKKEDQHKCQKKAMIVSNKVAKQASIMGFFQKK
ncbi:DNA polymerase delta subunit 3 [Denticeps clupeoides]|uniref:DNA polymerase delta subunit 3 n=1 Tax=Denticeps clupeoides TaxID=299321 RepID=A0AAY4A9V1_9TELE|nr:DNA polymerase delta subunit 3 [Denticeps clupeoides]